MMVDFLYDVDGEDCCLRNDSFFDTENINDVHLKDVHEVASEEWKLILDSTLIQNLFHINKIRSSFKNVRV